MGHETGMVLYITQTFMNISIPEEQFGIIKLLVYFLGYYIVHCLNVAFHYHIALVCLHNYHDNNVCNFTFYSLYLREEGLPKKTILG